MATETLTVVRDSSGTHPFVSSIGGNTYITVKAPDNTYHYYCPTTDDLLTAELSGGTWQTVYGLGSDGYLQSDGSEWVDTGWYFSGTKFDVNTKFNIYNHVAWGGISGVYLSVDGSKQYVSITIGYANNYIRIQNADGSYASYAVDYSYTLGTDVVFSMSYTSGTNTFTLDGSTRTQSGVSISQWGTNTLPLFARTNATQPVSAKLYYYQIKQDDVLVRDFIPIVYNNGTTDVYALYDNCLSNDVIYGNEGSGTFSGGGTQSALTYTHTIPDANISAVTASPSSATTESTITVTATLENAPSTDTGTVTFYTSRTPTVTGSWYPVGSKTISSQSSAGVVTHTFTGAVSPGTYYVKAILSDTTQSVTYDSYTDGSITNVTYTLVEPDKPLIGNMVLESKKFAIIESAVEVSATLVNTPSTDSGTVKFYTSPTPTVSSSWTEKASVTIASQTSGVVTAEWTAESDSGRYYIRAILTDTTQSATYDTFLAWVTPITYSLAPEEDTTTVYQLPPAEFRLCDEDNRMSIVISQYESFKYTEVWGDADTFSLTMKRTANHADELMSGRLLMVASDQTHDYYRVMVILQISVDEETITATGRDYLWDLLRGRVAVWANGVTLYRTSEVQTGNAETVARYFINQNCLQSPNVYRRDSFVVFEDERTSPLGGDVSVVAHMQGLDEIMASVCTQGNVDLYGALVEDTSLARGYYIKAMFRVGTDHSQDNEDDNPWVVLSEEYGNARLTEFISNVPESNVAEVSANGDRTTGTSGYIEYFNRTAGETTTTGISRREMFVEAGWCGSCTTGAAYTNAVKIGQEKLDNQFSESIEFELVNLNMYGRDFIIGDIITCDAGAYGSYDLQLTEVTTTYTPERTTISVSLGAEIPGVMSVIREAQRPTPIYDI